MRIYKDATSPWGMGVFFEDHEFESMMDETRLRAGSDVFTVGEGVDVDLVLLRVYGLNPDIADLPQGIHGRTLFQPDGSLDLQVSRELADEAERSVIARRRLRSTLAHECAHVTLHRHLYAIHEGPTLFDEMSSRQVLVLCRGSEITSPTGDYPRTKEWWEYQANRGMGSLLLPTKLLRDHVEKVLASLGLATMQEALGQCRGEEVVRNLAGVFDVSLGMMVYRLQERGWLEKNSGQLDLGFMS